MADFQTHIATSTLCGVGYAGAGVAAGLPVSSCLLAGGLCSLAGMLPDLDSDSGVPVRETMTLTAAVVPMLMVDRLQQFGLSHEMLVLTTAGIYATVRFGVAAIFKRYTVHRGMWHSIPACLTAGLITFLVVAGDDLAIRLFKALAVTLGFFSHLLLDEIWSFGVRRGRLSVKKSFGTALKFWGPSSWANFSTYAKLAIVTLLAIGDPMLMEVTGHEMRVGKQTAREWISQALQTAGVVPREPPPETWR